MPGSTDAGKQRGVLSVVAHQIETADTLVRCGERLHGRPAAVAATIVHQHDFERTGETRQDSFQPVDELVHQDGAVVDRNNGGNREGTALRLHAYFSPNGSRPIR